MHLYELEIANFRNLANQLISFPEKTTLIIGNNGQGKTSIIEAIYLLSQAKSFRGAKPRDLVNWDAKEKNEQCYIKSRSITNSGEINLSYNIENHRRKIFINDKPVKQAKNFYGQIITIAFTPDDLNLVKGSPSVRRKFIDKILSMLDANYFESLIKYQRAVKNRNALFSTSRNSVTPTEVSVWNKSIIDNGLFISRKRAEFIDKIRDKLDYIYCYISKPKDNPVFNESASLEYKSDFYKEGRLLKLEEALDLFDNSFEKDRKILQTTRGIHKDDIEITLDVGCGYKSAKSYASQGQSRLIAISLFISSAEVIEDTINESPILLLDDVESELDKARNKRLFELIISKKFQTIITSTSVKNGIEELKSGVQIIDLDKGKIQPQMNNKKTSNSL